MVRRIDSETITPIYGFYSFTTEEQYCLTEDCADLARLLGFKTDELIGTELADLISYSCRAAAMAALKTQLEQCGETEVLINFTKADGTGCCVLSRGKIEEDRFGNEYVRNVFVCAEKTGQMVAQLKDMTEIYRTKLTQNEKRIDLLQTYAEQDSLTGILNAGTTRRLAEEYITAMKSRCAMIIIDIDDFKRVNDRHGHMSGDELLMRAANVLKKQFRSNDIVGRIGGDEFLVLMKDISDKDIVSVRCSQIVSAFHDMHFDSMKNARMSCSVGAAVSESGNFCYDDLFLSADKAMYRAKRSGGNGYVVETCVKQEMLLENI